MSFTQISLSFKETKGRITESRLFKLSEETLIPQIVIGKNGTRDSYFIAKNPKNGLFINRQINIAKHNNENERRKQTYIRVLEGWQKIIGKLVRLKTVRFGKNKIPIIILENNNKYYYFTFPEEEFTGDDFENLAGKTINIMPEKIEVLPAN